MTSPTASPSLRRKVPISHSAVWSPSEKSGWKIHIEAEDLKDKTTVIVNYSFAGGVYSQFSIDNIYWGEYINGAEDKEDTYEYTIVDNNKNNGLDIVWRSGEVTIYSITVE